MKRPYPTIHKNGTQALAGFLTQNGQVLLPMVELIEQSKLAVDELIDVLGRASARSATRVGCLPPLSKPSIFSRSRWVNCTQSRRYGRMLSVSKRNLA